MINIFKINNTNYFLYRLADQTPGDELLSEDTDGSDSKTSLVIDDSKLEDSVSLYSLF